VIDDGETTIKKNPEPWNKRANTLYIESPAGVGFSIAGGPHDSKHNDMSSSKDAHCTSTLVCQIPRIQRE